ncbi:MAG: DUF1269 domain-containing protein [Nitriliruptor sp.]|uniref:DUF1269 domain-containing protein n=1 Tax=Nitriliruptor sp. TaxID=2448056 RepID=UPI0034A056A7
MSTLPPPPPPPFEEGDAWTDEERLAQDATAERARGGSAADLWAFVFDGPLRAQEALLAAMRMVGRGQLKLEDAAVVTRVGGRVRIQQTRDVSPSQGAVGGAWLGTLAGLFVAQPILGAALGAAAGGLFGKLRDHGIDDGEMKRLGEELGDGEAALFLLVEECHQMRALHEISRFPGRLLTTSADPDLADQVRERFAVDPWG